MNKAVSETPYCFYCSQLRRDDSQRCRFLWVRKNEYQMLTNHKQALIQSNSARNDTKSIQVSTYGIFYMGTPHQGESSVRLGELMHNAAPLFENPGCLQLQLAQYAPISTYFETKLGYERYPTLTATGEVITVSILYFFLETS